MADTINTKKLFDEFPPVTTEQWEEKIQVDLKGADREKKLVWKTLEGFKAQPYYRAEDLTDKQYLEAMPGTYPFTRGNKKTNNDWEIRQDIKLDSIETANQKSLFVLERGISSLGFSMPQEKGATLLNSQEDFSKLLNNIYFECIHLHFVCGYNAPQIMEFLIKEIDTKKIDPTRIIGSVDFDPIGYLTTKGNYGESKEADFTTLKGLIETANNKLPNYKVLAINGFHFTNAGASVVQELGYSLAMAAEYMNRLTDAGLSIDTMCKHTQLNLGVGSNYFMEIAKIRAARYLWAKMVEAYKPSKEHTMQADIHSITSEWNQTIYDPYVNVLRATTESMAAVIGGTDSLTVRPFTWSYKETSKFSGRVARNIQIILKEEAYLGNIVDPSAGSYYIENLTNSIINEAWNIFLQIEDEGGYLEALKKGVVQTDIVATAANRNKLVATRREVFLGTNQYANTAEKVADEIDEDIAFPAPVPGDTLITPIKKYRGAESYELLRLAVEQHNKQPKVFLLTYGNLTMRKARAGFSSNFFACAGYEIIDNLGFESAEEGVKAALKAKADIVVVCSSDDEYAELVPEVKSLINDKAITVVAGAPKCMDELKEKGIEYFIHMKSNLLETLKGFHRELGIEI